MWKEGVSTGKIRVIFLRHKTKDRWIKYSWRRGWNRLEKRKAGVGLDETKHTH